MSASEKKVQTAILLKLGKKKELRLWVHNVGVGYGLHAVRKAIALLKKGQLRSASTALLSAPVITWGIPGQSDISGIHDSGRAIWIEVKAKGKLRYEGDKQVRWGRMIRKYGGFYVCVDSVEMAEQALRAEGLIDDK